MSRAFAALPGALEVHEARTDRLRLRIGIARPLVDGRSLLVFTGRTEFIEKHEETLVDLRARGFRTAIIDWRGQGASDRLLADRRRGYVRDFDDFQRDVDTFEAVVGDVLPRPWFALAHSMGSLILLEALRRRPERVAKAVLSSPFLGIDAPAPLRRAAPHVARAICKLGLAERYVPGHGDEPAAGEDPEGNVLTSDHDRFRRYRARCRDHSDLLVGGVTWGWLRAALDAIETLGRPGVLERITTPLLVLTAGNERVVDPGAAGDAVRRLPQAELRRFEGAEHELLMERDLIRDRVLDAVDTFLR